MKIFRKDKILELAHGKLFCVKLTADNDTAMEN